MLRFCSALALVATMAPLAGCGSSLATAGKVAADGRAFVQTPKYAGQAFGDAVSLVAEPEFKLKSESAAHTATLRPFYRLDPVDERRSHADLHDASYKLSVDAVELAAGVGTFSWGVLESHRPTDVLNQIDFVETPTGTVKRGQPFASVSWSSDKVTLRAYGLPYFRDRTFPGLRGRLRFPAVVDVDAPEFDSRFGRWHPSGAARVTFDLGAADLGLGLFTGLSREPRFVAELTTGNVAPRYEPMHQGSADFQWAVGAFVFKAESLARVWRPGSVFFAGGGGLDFTPGPFIAGTQLTLAAEFLYDTRPVEAAPTFFEHDAFGGLRLSFEDEASTEVTGGAFVDVLDGTTFGHLESSRRFGEHWRLKVDANAYFASSRKLEGGFARDHFGRLELAYHF